MVEPLVIPFVVVVRDELAAGATPRALADQDHALEAGFLDGAHEALRVGVQVRRGGGGRKRASWRYRAYPRPYTVSLTQVLPVIDLRVAFLDERSRAGLAGERRHAVCLRVAFNAGDRMDQFSCRTGV